MKKFLKVIIIGIVIIALICLVQKLDILGFSVLDISEEKILSYSGYYFNQLELDEQKIYIKVDETVKSRETKVPLGNIDTTNLTEKVTNVLSAYFYDNPKCYYIANEYTIHTRDLKVFKYSSIGLNYITMSDSEIETKNKELEVTIDKILEDVIKEGMSDFEKEVVIHDALVHHVNYYEYDDINNIPDIKHTAYGALVQKEAVCDGYSKAFKLLLDKVGIDNIIVSGMAENVAHAWNIVKLNEEYYHVDITSDKIADKNNKYVVHKYFNVTDEEIAKTHTLDDFFEYPKCNYKAYDYYTYNGYYLNYEDNLYIKLRKIITKQNTSKILEVKADERYYSRNIIGVLYDLNFDNWRSSGKTSVEYNKIGNVYAFVK